MATVAAFEIADRVKVSKGKLKGKKGYVRYVGRVSGKGNAIYIGVELDKKLGKHDGKVKGKRYFTCKSKYGYMTLADSFELFKKKSPKKVINSQTIKTQKKHSEYKYDELLTLWNMSKYINKMADEGWDDPIYWKDLTDDILKNDINFAKGHINKFNQKYKEWSEFVKNEQNKMQNKYQKQKQQQHEILINETNETNETKEYEQWDVDMIMQWMNSLENGKYVKYSDALKQAFISEGIKNGSDLLVLDNQNDLRSEPFNIGSIVVRKCLITHIQSLQFSIQQISEQKEPEEPEEKESLLKFDTYHADCKCMIKDNGMTLTNVGMKLKDNKNDAFVSGTVACSLPLRTGITEIRIKCITPAIDAMGIISNINSLKDNGTKWTSDLPGYRYWWYGSHIFADFQKEGPYDSFDTGFHKRIFTHNLDFDKVKWKKGDIVTITTDCNTWKVSFYLNNEFITYLDIAHDEPYYFFISNQSNPEITYCIDKCLHYEEHTEHTKDEHDVEKMEKKYVIKIDDHTHEPEREPCFNENAMILMADGTRKKVCDLQIGDLVVSFPNHVSRITCIVVSKVNKLMKMVKLNDFYITFEHPVLIEINNNNNGINCDLDVSKYRGLDVDGLDSNNMSEYNLEWVLPTKINNVECRFEKNVYNFVLDSHHVMNVNGFWCCTLGHDYKGTIIEHEFWGNSLAINTFLKTDINYPNVIWDAKMRKNANNILNSIV